MKVNKQFPNQEEQFVPFDLVLSIESKEEAQALYAIFNKGNNSSILGRTPCEFIKEAIGGEYYIEERDTIIANGITYGQYYGVDY